MTNASYFSLLANVRETTTIPVVAMGYYNWPHSMGHDSFASTLSALGVVGWILPDLPLEESADLRSHTDKHDLASIFMMTPTDSDERLAEIARATKGFVYCALRTGVTGQETKIGPSTVAFLDRCRRASVLPLAGAFGVESGADVEALRDHVDIVVVGSALLRRWQRGGDKGFEDLLDELTSAVR